MCSFVLFDSIFLFSCCILCPCLLCWWCFLLFWKGFGGFPSERIQGGVFNPFKDKARYGNVPEASKGLRQLGMSILRWEDVALCIICPSKYYYELSHVVCFTGKLFWYKVNLNVHVRTHTKEHLHYCSECSYSSITKSSLKRHQIQKHGDLQLPCPSPGCKYTTLDKYKLQAHLRALHEQVTKRCFLLLLWQMRICFYCWY